MRNIIAYPYIIISMPCTSILSLWIFFLWAISISTSSQADPELVNRGAYLAKIADCESCHTAGPDHPLFAGGLPINSPFGIIYSTNITPDPNTGIGKYSYEDFDRAVRKGIAKGEKYLYPAMPYDSFSATLDSDIKALYAYFMEGVEAVNYTPPQTKLPFPFNQRWTIMFWNAVFATQEPYKPRADRGAQWNRGAYLVQALGHCGSCHTPRGLAFQQKAYTEASSDYLSGGVVENWYAADLTGNHASGLGRWSQAEISSFLETGHSHQGVALGNMVMVIENSTQYLHKDDLDAIAHYLKSLPGRKGKSSYKPEESSFEQDIKDGQVREIGINKFELPGAGLYSGFCAECHKSNGAGKPLKIPQLAGNSIVLSENPITIIRHVLEGGTGPQTKNGPKPKEMPGFKNKFSDREIADVLTFIRNSWGNAAPAVTTRQVTTLRKKLD